MKSVGCLIALLSAAFLNANCMASEGTAALPKLNVGDVWTYRITAEEPNSSSKITSIQYEVLQKTPNGIAIAIEKGEPAHII